MLLCNHTHLSLGGTLSPSPFDMSGLGDSLSDDKQASIKKTPHSFLGENSSLVNLDNLVAIGSKPAMSIPPPGTIYLTVYIRCLISKCID